MQEMLFPLQACTCLLHVKHLFFLTIVINLTAGLKLDLKIIELNIPNLHRDPKLQIKHSCRRAVVLRHVRVKQICPDSLIHVGCPLD